MQQNHLNERGSHTTIIEAALPILDFFTKHKDLAKVQVAPGKIEANVGAKSKSVKFKHINNELYEMVITHNGSRQEFKVFTTTPSGVLLSALKSYKKTRDWNSNYTDMRGVHKKNVHSKDS
jgi:hypothetical protein